MKKKNLIILVSIPIITLLLPLVWINYQSNVDPEFQPPQYLESYLLAGFIIAEIILTVSSWFLQDKSNVRGDLKEHTKEINKIFIRMTEAVIREREKGLTITLPTKEGMDAHALHKKDLLTFIPEEYHHRIGVKYLKLDDDYYFFEFAMEHLKKYKDIYKHWEKTEKLIDEFNLRERIIPTIEKTVNEKINDFFPDFQKHWGESDTPNFYEPQTITSAIKTFLDYPEAHCTRFLIKQRNEMNIVVSMILQCTS